MKEGDSMSKRIRRVLNKKGVTLMELIVALLVFSLILTAVTSIFGPFLRAHIRANDFAEANTLLDNLATIIMNEVNNSTGFEESEGRIGNPDPSSDMYSFTPAPLGMWEIGNMQGMAFRIGNDILEWSAQGGVWQPLLDQNFYVGKALSIGWSETDGLVSVTIRLQQVDGWWQLERTYMARPLGMVNNTPEESEI